MLNIINTKMEGLDGVKSFVVAVDKEFSKNIKEALESLGRRLSDRIRENFDLEGAREGHESWEVRKNPTPLYDTGVLYNSIEGKVLESSGHYMLLVGTDVDYAEIHDNGGTVETDVVWAGLEGRSAGISGWKHTEYSRTIKIPKREFLFLTKSDLETIDDEGNSLIKNTLDTAAEVASRI
jgi:phage gpG-like protein